MMQAGIVQFCKRGGHTVLSAAGIAYRLHDHCTDGDAHVRQYWLGDCPTHVPDRTKPGEWLRLGRLFIVAPDRDGTFVPVRNG
jgi:ribosome modulation factor